MAVVNGTSGTMFSGNTNSINNTKRTENSAVLAKEDFLKLLIAQLQNQNPMSPMDDTQFVAQLAQFSSLEQMANMASAIDELKKDMVILSSQTLLAQGAAMIGKEVTGYIATGKKDENGSAIMQEISGTVTSVKWLDGSLTLMVGETALSMENIKEIKG